MRYIKLKSVEHKNKLYCIGYASESDSDDVSICFFAERSTLSILAHLTIEDPAWLASSSLEYKKDDKTIMGYITGEDDFNKFIGCVGRLPEFKLIEASELTEELTRGLTNIIGSEKKVLPLRITLEAVSALFKGLKLLIAENSRRKLDSSEACGSVDHADSGSSTAVFSAMSGEESESKTEDIRVP